MANQARNLRDVVTKPKDLRMWATKTEHREFAQAGAIKLLPQGTVVARHGTTGELAEYVDGDPNLGNIYGIVYLKDGVEVTTAGEKYGVVMTAGTVHFEDLIADGANEAQLRAELAKERYRTRGLDIRGLEKPE